MRRLALLVLGCSMVGCTAIGSIMDGMAGYAAIPPTDDPRWFYFGKIILPVLSDLIGLLREFLPLFL